MRPTRLVQTTGFRLTTFYAGVFGLSVLVLFVVIYWITSSALSHQLTATVENEVAALVEDHQAGGLSQVAQAIDDRLSSSVRPTTFYLLQDSNGRKIAGDLSPTSPREGWQEHRLPRGHDDDADDDPEEEDEHRLLGLGSLLSDGSFLMVGQDLYRIREVEEAVVQAFEWAFGVTILLGVTGGVILSVGFLRRVDSINQTTQAIVAGNLANRVPTRGTDDELDRLALNFNEMLDRVQSLMEGLHQVSSDIAHDLRTPLSRLRQRLEEARASAHRTEDYAIAVDQAIADTDAILGTFSALLRIAQIEAGTRKAAFSTIDLSGTFRSIADAYTAVAEDQGQTLVSSIETDVQVHGDRELLTQMLANLVENTIRHTPEGTRIELSLESTVDGPVGVVADTGPGIPPEFREKVFRRFFRLERSRSTAGNGLGLSLVAAVVELHGIGITLADNEPGLKVRLGFSPRKPA